MLIKILLSSFLLFQIKAQFHQIQFFSEIQSSFKKYPYKLASSLITVTKDCQLCPLGNKAYSDYSIQNSGIVNSFFIDCDLIWKNQDDRNRVPSCNPDQRELLPLLTFFVPENNKKIHRTTPYEGILSPEALLKKTKELMPYFIKDISNQKQLQAFLANQKAFAKVLLFVEDSENIPLYFRSLSGEYKDKFEVIFNNKKKS